MTDTATKQRIKGDLDDRVDELEEEVEKNLLLLCKASDGLLRQAMTMDKCADAMLKLQARLDKLESK